MYFFVCFLLFIKKVKDIKSQVPEGFEWNCGQLSQVAKKGTEFACGNHFSVSVAKKILNNAVAAGLSLHESQAV